MNAVVRGANLFASHPASRRKPILPGSKLTVLLCFVLPPGLQPFIHTTVQSVERTDSQSVPETSEYTPQNRLRSQQRSGHSIGKFGRDKNSRLAGSNDSVILSVKTTQALARTWGDEAGKKPTPELAMPCPETSLSVLHVCLQGTEVCFCSLNHRSVSLILQDLITENETRDREIMSKRSSFADMLLVEEYRYRLSIRAKLSEDESFVRAMLYSELKHP
jgi:hypothetical protein